MDCSPPGSFVRGIFQARILEWVVISFSGDLPGLGVKSESPVLQADSLPLNHEGSPFLDTLMILFYNPFQLIPLSKFPINQFLSSNYQFVNAFFLIIG